MNKINGYVAFYNGKRAEVHAPTTYAAQQAAARIFGVKEKNRYKVSVMLAEKGGEEVVHVADF